MSGTRLHDDEDEGPELPDKIRIKFETLSKRLQKINVDVIHQRPDNYNLEDTSPFHKDVGEYDCFLWQELIRLRTLDTSLAFKRLHEALYPYVQSLPELMHHQKKVVKILVEQLSTFPMKYIGSLFGIVSVFTRDLKEDFKPYFDELFSTVINLVPKVSMSGGATETEHAPNPELTAQLFETLSYLIKANLTHLSEQPDDLSPYYGAVLGSSTSFVRDFAAKTFSIVLRKLQNKEFKLHFKRIFKATAANIANVLENDFSQLTLFQDQEPTSERPSEPEIEDTPATFASLQLSLHSNQQQKKSVTSSIRRCNYLFDGLSKLLFYSFKGIKGCLHSKAIKRINTIFALGFNSFLQIKTKDIEKKGDEDTILKEKFFLQVHGLVTYKMSQHLIYHLSYDNQTEFLQEILQFIQSTIKEVKEEYFFTGSNIEELYVLLVIQFLQQILSIDKLWKYNLQNSKRHASAVSQFLKVNRDIILLIIDNTLELFQLLHNHDANHSAFQATTIQQSKEIFTRVWLLFPTVTPLLDTPKLQKMLLPVLENSESVEKNIFFFASKLFHHLPKPSREDILLPFLIAAVEKMFDNVSQEEWLSIVLKLFFILQDHRKNTDQLLGLVLNSNSSSLPSEQFKSLSSILETKFVEEIDKNFKTSTLLNYSYSTNESNGTHLTLRLNLLVMNWMVKNVPSQVSLTHISEKVKKFMKHLYQLVQPRLQVESYGMLVHATELYISVNRASSSLRKEMTFLQTLVKKLLTFFVQQPTSLHLASVISSLLGAIEEVESEEDNEEAHYVLEALLTLDLKEKLLLAISEGLTSSSYYRKYYLIQILKHIEPPIDRTNRTKTVVTANKREMDDSDEEGYGGGVIQTENEIIILDIAKVCQEVLSLPIDIQHEREIRRQLENLEVYCRGNKISKEFMAVIAGFALGMLFSKFKPIWTVSISILTTIAQSEKGDEIIWPLYFNLLEKTSSPDSTKDDAKPSNIHEVLTFIEKYDTVDTSLSPEIKSSAVFFIPSGPSTNELPVPPDAVADRETVYLQLLEFLRKAPAFLLKKSKLLVEHFINFLNDVYYVAYSKDPEIGSLQRMGLLTSEVFMTHKERRGEEPIDTSGVEISWIARKEINKRLEAFLKAFAVVPSPKQLYKFGLLFAFYHELLTKADTTIAKLAFECVLTFKPVYAVPYKDSLKNLFDDKSFRNELVNIDTENTTITSNGEEKDYRIKGEHRDGFYHLILRILFGRLLSKPTAKRNVNEQIAARRSAIIAFIIRTNPSAVMHLLYLMIRGIAISIDSDNSALSTPLISEKKREVFTSDITKVEEFLSQGYSRVQKIYSTMEKDFEYVSWQRLQGFLHLLGPVFHIFGAAVQSHVQLLYGIILKILQHSHQHRVQLIAAVDIENLKSMDIEEDVGAEDGDDEAKQEIEEVDTSFFHNDSSLAISVRTLCLQRFADIYEGYFKILKIEEPSQELFPIIEPLVAALPSAVCQAKKKPALLILLEKMASHDETLPIITSQSMVVEKLIECIAFPYLELNVSRAVFMVLNFIFDSPLFDSMIPYSELLVRCFTTRFHSATGADSNETLKLSDVVCKSLGGLNIELELLCKVASKIFSRKDIVISSLLATNLATIMLGMLRSYLNSKKLKVREEWILNVFSVYKTLIWRMEDVSSHLIFLSRLFGPTPHPSSLFNKTAVRLEIVNTYEVVGNHKSVKKAVAQSIELLKSLVNYENSSMISSGRNIDSFMPAVKGLSGTQSIWTDVLGPSSFERLQNLSSSSSKKKKNNEREIDATKSPRSIEYHLLLSSGVVFELLRTLYDEEIPVRTAGAQAIRSLITECLVWHREEVSKNLLYQANDWLALLKLVIMPAIRKGIQSSSDLIKATFVSILVHVIRSCDKANIHEEIFHTDLIILTHEDPEQDFFENIVHIQLHRRTRAFFRLKNQLINDDSSAKETKIGQSISTASLMNILLPIGFFYLTSNEFSKKIHRQFLQEIAGFIGALVYYLPFNHYLSTFRKLMKILERSTDDKQSIIQIALASMLDHFHYDLSTLYEKKGHDQVLEVDAKEDDDDEEEEDKNGVETPENEKVEKIVEESQTPRTIADTVINFIFPTVKSFLIKETTDQDNKKTKMVQTNIAIALTNLLKQLQPPLVTPEKRLDIFSNLVLGIVDTLKSKDVNIRDAARNCLTKMVHILGFAAFERILYEMQTVLTEGYQRHVQVYSVRSILTQIAENYCPPTDARILTMEELADLQTSKEIEDATSAPKSKTEKLDRADLMVKLNIPSPEFDGCIPYIMKSVLLDISDVMREEREDTDGIIRTSSIREMKGSKFNEILEITSRSLLFRPTYALLNPSNPSSVSSIHAVSTPLLDFLSANADAAIDDFTEATRSGRVAEALQRVAQGLSKNPSLDSKELLLYIHASLQPFVSQMLQQYRKYKESTGKIVHQATAVGINSKKDQKRKKKTGVNKPEGTNGESLDYAESDLELILPSYLREESSDEEESFAFLRKDKKSSTKKDEVTGFKAASWLPADWNSIKEQKQVIADRNRAQKEMYRVQDGASAPKLTGRNRYDKVKRSASSNNGIEKTTLIAIKYCLTLLVSCLKKGVFKPSNDRSLLQIENQLEDDMDVENRDPEQSIDIQGMLVPFIPILRSFLHIPNASEIIILSIKCLSQLIQQNVHFENTLLNAIAHRVLMIMIQYNASKITAENELCQVCIQFLLAVFRRYNTQHKVRAPVKIDSLAILDHRTTDESSSKEKNKKLMIDYPLSEGKMKLLIESLTLAIVESNHSFQVIIFQLIREIIQTHILLPEIYDLVLPLTDQIVLSHYKNIRLLSSKIIISFLLSYPISKKRHEAHMDKLLGLCNYTYETGRVSAYETIYYVIDHFPIPVIEDYAVKFFLHMTVRLSHEVHSKVCQQEIMKVLFMLFQKIEHHGVSTQKMEDYLFQWLGSIMKPLSNYSDWNDLRQNEAVVGRSMLELVIIGCKLVNIFLQSITKRVAASGNKTKLSKHQKDFMRKCYSTVYENILTVLEFHFLLDDSNSEDYVQQRLKAISSSSLVQTEEKSSLSSFLIIPSNSKYWIVLYHLLGVFDASYEWNAEQVDQFISTVDLSTLASSAPSSQLLGLLTSSSSHSYSSSAQRMRLFMEMICELLLYNHSWIRSVCLRILSHYLTQRISLSGGSSDVAALNRLSISSTKSVSTSTYLQRLLQQREKRLSIKSQEQISVIENEILLQPNSFYYISRKLCLLLSQFSMKSDYLKSLIQTTTLMISCMCQHPELDTVAERKRGGRTKKRGREEENAMKDDEAEESEREEEEEEIEFEDNDQEEHDEREEVQARNLVTEGSTSNSKKFEEEEDENLNVEASEEDGDEVVGEDIEVAGKRKRTDADNADDADDGDETDDDEEEEDLNGFEDEEGGNGKHMKSKRGIVWIMNRLRAIGADSRGTRRIRILQLYYSLINHQSQDFLLEFLPQIMEIPIRSVLAHTRVQQQLQAENRHYNNLITVEGDIEKIELDDLSRDENAQWQYVLSSQLLRVIEEKVDPAVYMSYYNKISTFLQQRKAQKRVSIKSEAIHNPAAFAQKKLLRNKLKSMNKKHKDNKFMKQKGKRRRMGSH